MRIHRVVARAFGPFRGESLDLAPGLTVVAGPNEAGKSTFHAALRLAITGVRRGKGPGSAAERLLAERHRPWDDPERWEVEARISLDDGRTIDITQDLAGKVACRAVDVALGRDVSDEILDGTPDASRWLGLDRESFAATVSVGQAQILGVVEAADRLQEQMQRAAATRGTDATAAEAIARLEQFRRDAVGADTIAAKGPLRAARNALAAAEERLDEARRLHAAYLEESAALDAAEERVEDARRALAAEKAAAERREATHLARRLARAEELLARHPDAPPPVAAGEEEANQAAAALEAWASRPVPQRLDGRSAEELAAELANIPAVPDGDLAPDPRVIETLRGLDLAEEAVRLHGDEPLPDEEGETTLDPAELRDLARRLRTPQLPQATALERQLAEARQDLAAARGIPWGPLGIAGLAGIVGLALVVGGWQLPGLTALLACGLAASWLVIRTRGRRGASARLRQVEAALAPFREATGTAERERAAALAEARAANLPAEPAALDELADRAAGAQRDRRLLADWRSRRAALESRREAAAAALRSALRQRDAAADGDPRVAYAAYLAACETRAAQARDAARADSLRRELDSRLVAERAVEAARAAIDAAEVRVRDVATGIGLPATADAEEAAGRLRGWLAARAAELERHQAALLEWQELQGLLDGAGIEGLRARASVHALRADGLAAPSVAHEAASQDPGSAITAAREVLARHQSRADSLRGSLATLSSSLPDVAESEEALEAARAELGRVGELARTLDEALRLLRAAEEQVHRSLAPVLGEAIGRWLPVVSGGAYVEASVDPSDLAIRVKEAASGRWRTARNLSEGTREQIYLLLRVAMAQHLVSTGETSPLLLDEVTAQSDGARKRELLGVLHHLSAERQVILFTHDDDVVAWAEEMLDVERDALVRLPALAVAAPALPAAEAAARPATALSIGPTEEASLPAGLAD